MSKIAISHRLGAQAERGGVQSEHYKYPLYSGCSASRISAADLRSEYTKCVHCLQQFISSECFVHCFTSVSNQVCTHFILTVNVNHPFSQVVSAGRYSERNETDCKY